MAITHPSFGTLEDNRVIFFDTTLRDGEQSPGFSMNLNEKIRMAEALAELGVDVMEAGFAIASPGDFESVQAIARKFAKDGPVVASLGRCNPADIMKSAEALKPAARKRIHIVLATSDLHMRVKLNMTREEVLQLTHDSVTLARNNAEDVEWSAEDGSRSDPDFLCKVVEVAIRAGATTINIPDTVGYSLPEDMAAIFHNLRNRVPGIEKVILSAHNHNDLGLGVANTLAAVRAGARQVEVTINGIGERAGNASLEEVAMALRTRHDAMPYTNNINTRLLLATSQRLAQITGQEVQLNKAIVGQNAFAHESGIHQDGILKDRTTYEIMTPESVGWSNSTLVLGKHSGRAAFRDKLNALGFNDLGPNQVNALFQEFKVLADLKKVVHDEDVVALVDQNAGTDKRLRLLSLTVQTTVLGEAVEGMPRATATALLEIDGERVAGTATGDGGVDAAYNAVKAAYPYGAQLMSYKVKALTPDTSAQAQVTVQMEEHGRKVDGRGVDPDTITASVRALLDALNRLPTVQEKVPVPGRV